MRPSRFLVAIFVSLVMPFSISTSSSAQTVTNIYSFTGNNSSAYPFSTPAQGRDGRLYVTTSGTLPGYGSILAVGTDGKAGLFHVFDDIHGSGPFGGIILSTDGNFYGTAAYGGSANAGVLFRISKSGRYSVLHEFASGADGQNPFSPPVEASDGNLYGTTLGSARVGSTLYKYSPSTGYSVLREFYKSQGRLIGSSPIQASDGNLYVTANNGGTNRCGAVLKLALSGTLLSSYSFACGAGGANPNGQLLQASDGNFYGTTQVGGAAKNGTVYKLDQSGTISVLYSFLGSPTDGSDPDSGLAQATDGNLYGTTIAGGSANQGTLFQISTTGVYTPLFEFGYTAGQYPYGGPMQDTNGLIYGTVYQGGTDNFGAVYSLNMGLGPFVSLVLPVGKVGGTAQILGQGLTGTTSVTFNGVPATSFSVVSDTYMTAVVPSGATTGKVVVTTPGGALTSNVSFRVVN
jgi:uncharacterized repeat protein (TIGR03803 family)